MKNNRMKNYIIALIAAFLLVLLDQYTKYLAVLNLKGKNPFIILKDIFQLQYLENSGAAFGILQNKRIFFYLCAILIVCLVAYFYHKVPMEQKFLPLRICGVLLVSGALGNLIDRARLNYVVDFFYFKLIDFPIFNVADIYVTLSAFMLILLIIFYYKEEDFDRIFSRSSK